MSVIQVSFCLLILIVSFSVSAANENLLKIVHGTQMDQCKHVQSCDPGKIRHCEQVTKAAFESCDQYIANDKADTDLWSSCVADYLNGQLGDDVMLQFMLSPACTNTGNQTTPPASDSVKNTPQYFIINSADITSPQLMPSPIAACRSGAEQQMLQSKKDRPEVSFLIEISGARKGYMIAGDGEEMYNHLFNRTTYMYGECVGRAETKFLKDYMGYKAGEKISSSFSATIYVVVDCSEKSKNAICD